MVMSNASISINHSSLQQLGPWQRISNSFLQTRQCTSLGRSPVATNTLNPVPQAQI